MSYLRFLFHNFSCKSRLSTHSGDYNFLLKLELLSLLREFNYLHS